MPDRVFHYTDARGFYGIVDSGHLWMSNAAYLNDPIEVAYGLELIGSILTAYEPRGAHSDFLNDVKEFVSDPLIANPFYVGSLCCEDDLLSQWRTYCKGGGYAIGFEGGRLQDSLSGSGLDFGHVSYDRQEQATRIRSLLDDYFENFTAGTGAAQGLARELRFEGLFMKQPGFSEEREWRLVWEDRDHAPISNLGKKLRVSNDALLPYVEAKLANSDGVLPLYTVRVSPFGEPSRAQFAAENLLEMRNYPRAMVRRSKLVARA